MWTLSDAMDLIRSIQQDTRKFDYHLCVGGGVVNNGFSEKDLDLYFLPLSNRNSKPKPDELIKWLTEMWGTPTYIGPEYPRDEIRSLYQARTTTRTRVPVRNSTTYTVERPIWRPESIFSNDWITETETVTVPPPPPKDPYLYKLKFMRPSDRIDVFIL